MDIGSYKNNLMLFLDLCRSIESIFTSIFVPRFLQDKHSPEGLKVHHTLVPVEKFSERDRKEFRAPWGHLDHRAPLGYKAKDCQGRLESQDLPVLKATLESEKLACQDCQGNLEDLDYQGQKAI